MTEAAPTRDTLAPTPSIVDLIDASDFADPIARQYAHDGREFAVAANERVKPIGLEYLGQQGVVGDWQGKRHPYPPMD